MNQPLNKPSSIAPGIAALFVAAAGAFFTLLPTGDALADEAADVEADNEEIRFDKSLQPASDRDPLDLRVYRERDDTRRIWHIDISVEGYPDERICYSTVPIEAGRDFYQFRLTSSESEGDGHFALLEAVATGDEGPLDPPAYQLAFHLRPDTDSGDWKCTVVGRGQFTELDGGPRLALQDIDDTPSLARYDATRDIDFCGLRSEEEESFEKFDADSGRFLAGFTTEISAEGADELAAKVPESSIVPPLTEGFFAWVSATSDIRGAPKGVTVRRPRMLGTQDFNNPWIEGSDELGIGEFVTASVNTAADLKSLRIFPGHGHSRESFEAYARPTRLLIGLSDGARYAVDLPDVDFDKLHARGGYYLELPEPTNTRCMSVMILDAVPGTLANSSDDQERRIGHSVAISELTPLSVLDADTEAETANRLIEKLVGESDIVRRDQIAEFGALIPNAFVDAIAEILQTADASLRRRIVPYLGQIEDEKSLPVLSAHFLRIEPEDSDYLRTKRAIATHGSRAAPTLLDILDQLDPDERKYVDTIRTIGRVGSDIDRIQLISGLGEGGEFLRRERVRAIANGESAVVPRLISAAASAGDTEVGLDALTALVFIGQRRFSNEQAEIESADELASIYADSESRAHRIRAIEAMGYYYHLDTADLLGEQILSDDPDPVVRQFAAQALGMYSDAAARESLEAALDDQSPDVRISAIRALNRRDDANDATEAVIAYSRTEQWPRGLHHALHLLARSTDPAAKEAIADVLHNDITHPSAGTALRALRRSENPLPLDEIEDLFSNDDAPQSILEQLVHMLALDESDDADLVLIAIADGDYSAFDDRASDDIDRLRNRAFLGLGTSRTDRAKDYLLGVAGDDARQIEERRSALHGLGFFFDRELLGDLQALAPELPPELRERLRETISMIQSRLNIEDIELEMEELMEKLDRQMDQME